ncbi:FUSC family protein [Poseidonocella sp. HB161398]|uniref:FUSC family protein n=1 Tax=Poseidonocella sp. HB161398 TaxID=2320855 RepID=UPI0014860E16|nr:FUSC family protein [Poseidonocella sp. HB161398]
MTSPAPAPRPLVPDVPRAAQLFIAAFGALSLAHALGLTNPFWAAMPVWVVFQPWREDILIRGGLRFLGTAIGAGIGYGALSLTQNPLLLAAALALTAFAGVALAYWIGSIYSYGAMMAAMTCAVVMLPALAGTADPLDLALDRAWCTLIGVAAVTLATVAFTPPRETPHPFRFEHHTAGIALRRGAVAGLCAAAGISLVLATGSVIAMAAALSLCIFSAVMGSMSDPAPMLKNLLPGAALGVFAGIAWRFGGDAMGLAPEGMLLLAGAFIAIGALIRATPRIAPLGLDGNMCFLLSAEVGTAGHGHALHLQTAAALLAGAGCIVALYRLLRARALV